MNDLLNKKFKHHKWFLERKEYWKKKRKEEEQEQWENAEIDQRQIKFYSAKYNDYRDWIRDRRTDKFDWENIKYGLGSDEASLLVFLAQQRVNMLWDIDLNEWLELVEFERKNEELEATNTDEYNKNK